MTIQELETEKHYSSRLAKFLTCTGKPRPHELCEAHAIISGRHANAAKLRAVIAWHKLRIDDPDNGCWLPKNTAALQSMPKSLKRAIPHSRIHRFNYYFWLNQRINLRSTPSRLKISQELKLISKLLQTSTAPEFVMLKKGQGLAV